MGPKGGGGESASILTQAPRIDLAPVPGLQSHSLPGIPQLQGFQQLPNFPIVQSQYNRQPQSQGNLLQLLMGSR